MKETCRQGPFTCSVSATPTAAPVADQPTGLSLSLALRALSLPAPAIFNQGVIDVGIPWARLNDPTRTR